MVESAERRKKTERRRMAYIVAYAVNEPKALEKMVPEANRPEGQRGSTEGVEWDYDEWWE